MKKKDENFVGDFEAAFSSVPMLAAYVSYSSSLLNAICTLIMLTSLKHVHRGNTRRAMNKMEKSISPQATPKTVNTATS